MISTVLLRRNNIIIRDTLRKLGYGEINAQLANGKEGKYLIAYIETKLFLQTNKFPINKFSSTIVNCKEDIDLFYFFIANPNAKPEVIENPTTVVEYATNTFSMHIRGLVKTLESEGYIGITDTKPEHKYIAASSDGMYATGNNKFNSYIEFFDPDIITCKSTPVDFLDFLSLKPLLNPYKWWEMSLTTNNIKL